MTNAQHTLAVDAARQALVKVFRRQISNKIANAARNNALSARKEDGRVRYASLNSARNSFAKKI